MARQVWTDFLSPVTGTTISTSLFGIPVFKDIHHLRELCTTDCYLDAVPAVNVAPGELVAIYGPPGYSATALVRKTTTLAQTGTIGVALESMSISSVVAKKVQFAGIVLLDVDGPVDAGDWLRVSSTDGMAEACTDADPGIIARALGDSTTITGGQCLALLYPSLATGIAAGGGGGGGSGAALTAPPLAATWTVENGATVTDQANGVHVHSAVVGGGSTQIRGISLAYPGGSFERDCKFSLPMWGTSFPMAGPFISDGTKVKHFVIYRNAALVPVIDVRECATFATAGSSAAGAIATSVADMAQVWLRIRHDAGGGHRYYEWSNDDGQYWQAILDETIAGQYLTPTKIGFAVSNYTDGQVTDSTLMSWDAAAPSFSY